MGRKRIASRRGFPDHLYQNPDGYFYFINPLNGKKKGLGSDKTKAFFEARQANAMLATMQPSSLVSWVQGIEEHTLASWVPEYDKLWKSSKTLAASTLEDSIGHLRRISESDMGPMALIMIGTNHVSQFIDGVAANSGNGMAKNMRSRLKDVFKRAITKGLIKHNPVEASYVPQSTTTRERLSLEQFMDARKYAPTYLRNAMDLALITGQRRADIADMKFVDYAEGRLAVVQGKGQGRVRIKISGQLSLLGFPLDLDGIIKACRDNIVSPFIVHQHRNYGKKKMGESINPDTLTDAFNIALAKSGYKAELNRRMPTFHEIRSLSERLYKAERGMEFAQKLLGHSDIKTTSLYDDLRGTGWENIG